MDSLITSLGSLGGMGLLSAALLMLHREALKAFREELAEERDLFREELDKERQKAEARHAEVMEQLRRLGV